jgi:uncharacterized iron-regulated membrane protein
MKTFRSIFFWMHLAAGLIAGISIGIMCFTGTVIAFEDEIVEWSERDARQVAVPAAGTARQSLAELQQKLREAQPEFRAMAVTLQNDPAAAINFSAGREGGYYANPYTGEFRQPASTKTHDFMHLMVDWHRFLGRAGEQRPIGKAINGACNLAFAFLALSGLYLWMPRTWSWRGVKAIALFNWKISGKARDFNWHNSIGLWSAPILIVLTLTAVPISYRWGSNLVYRLVGEEPPVQGGPGAQAAPAVEIKRPTPESRPLAYDAIITRVQQDFPRWKTISLRSGTPQRAAAPQGGANAQPPAQSAARVEGSSQPREGAADAGPRAEGRRSEGGGAGGARAPQPLTVTIREPGAWPRTATTTLTLNPFTGEVLKREGFADFSTGRQLRTWTRFLHTGQALGWPGQLVAGLACLGGCFLVYTGFALSWRRFFGKKSAEPAPAVS